MKRANQVADKIKLDFEQAKAKHLLFKARLRSILFGAELDETPVLSQYECTVGKWIYGYALTNYAYIPEMHQLEEVHAELHTSAGKLVEKYKAGKIEEARKGLEGIEKISDQLGALLLVIETKVQESPSERLTKTNVGQAIDIPILELTELQELNQDLDRRIRQQSIELYEAKERFELVAKATQDAVWDWNLINNQIWWNEGFKTLFGYTDEQIESGVESWYNRVHPEDSERIVDGIHTVIDNGGKQWSDEYRFRKADGTYAIVYDRGYALYDDEGKPYRMVGSMSDITERKKLEEATKASEAELQQRVAERTKELENSRQEIERSSQRLAAIFNNAPSAMFTFSPLKNDQDEITDFRFVITNPTFAAYVGQTPEILNGALGSTWFPGYLHNGVFDMYKKTFLTGETQRIDIHYHVDQHDLYLDLMSTKVSDEVLVTFTDYTPLKRAQLQLEKYIEDLKRSNTNLEEFAYAASHDLKEPIRKIHFFGDRLKKSLNDRMTEEERRSFDRMEMAVKRMGSLIDDLLSYSQISIKPKKFETVDMNSLIDLVLGDLDLEIEEKRATIKVDKLFSIQGHYRQLQQAFQNLIGNALKYSNPATAPEITITCNKILGKDIGLHLSSEELQQTYYLVKVADNGIGFEQTDADRIFNVFIRLHGNAEFRGTGVGLSIVRKVVENHGGYVTAESEPGKGATFKVYLPVDPRIGQ